MIQSPSDAVGLYDSTYQEGSAYGLGGLWLQDPFEYDLGSPEVGTINNTLNSGTSVTIDTAVDNSLSGYTAASGSGRIVLDRVSCISHDRECLCIRIFTHHVLTSIIDCHASYVFIHREWPCEDYFCP